ncbi:MAG: helix-turn-helix domain-containing protein [Caldimonas sp.]
MSDGVGATAPGGAPTAGRLLREAREKQGLHIAALAAAIKVPTKKLELLESDRFDELPDATFTRALAQTVCRALKTDPGAVMRLLPPSSGYRLEQVGEGLNTPFRERPGALVQRDWAQVVANPAFWLTAVVLLAAVIVYFLPASVTGLAPARPRPAASSTTQGSAVEPGMPPDAARDGAAPAASASPAFPLVPPVAGADPGASSPAGLVALATALPGGPASAPGNGSAAADGGAALAVLPPGTLPPGMLQLRTVSASWVEVTDGRGQPLVSRLMKAGEATGVDGAPPLRVRIGNAAGTQLVFRGQPTDLKAFTRDNVARLELR